MTKIQRIQQASLISAMLVSFSGCSNDAPKKDVATSPPPSAPQPWNGGEGASAASTPPIQTSLSPPDDKPAASTPESQPAIEDRANDPAVNAPAASESTFKAPPIVTAPPPTAAAPSPELDFTRLELPANAGPKEVIDHLLEIDNSIKNLLLTQQARRITKDEALRQSAILSGLKYAAAEKLGQVAETPIHKDLAVLARMEALSHSAGMGDEKAANELRKLAGNPGNFVSPVAAHQAAVVMLGLELSDLSAGIRDASAVLSQLDVVLAEPTKLNRPEFFASAQVVRILDQHNLVDASRSAKKTIAAAFANHADPQIGMMLWQMQIVETAELNLFNQAVEDREIAPIEFQKRLDAVLAVAPSQWTLANLMQLLPQVEFTGQIEKAGMIASSIEQNAPWVTFPELVQNTQQVVQGFRKRVGAIGRTVSLEGLDIQQAGQIVDPKVLAGKVVLVDFWASTCQPCRAEFPNLREQYAKYRDRGFEIVGINIDEDIAAMQSVIRSDELTWIQARSSDPTKLGFATPQAVEFGVESTVPFMMLVGRDGKVMAIHTRGKILSQKLAELFP